MIVVATLSVPPAPASIGQKEIMLGHPDWPAPPPPHQRIVLVVHNPAHLLSGSPRWLPGMLLTQALQLKPGVAPPEVALPGGRSQAGAAAAAHKGGAASRSRRLAAAGGQGGGGAGPSAGAVAQAAAAPPRLQLLALSPNVASFTSAFVETWAGSIMGAAARPRVAVPWLPPLVPWQSSAAERAAQAAAEAGEPAGDEHTPFVGLGAGGPGRRMQHICIQVRGAGQLARWACCGGIWLSLESAPVGNPGCLCRLLQLHCACRAPLPTVHPCLPPPVRRSPGCHRRAAPRLRSRVCGGGAPCGAGSV